MARQAALRIGRIAPLLFLFSGCSGLPPDQVAGGDFDGIVALSNCSGAVVRFAGSSGDDKALVLTNGHCVEGGFIDPDIVLADLPSGRMFSPARPGATPARPVLQAASLVYATMSGTDIALYRLTESYDELALRHGVHARTLSARHPVVGTAVLIVSGLWHSRYACAIDGFVHRLKEKGWTFEDAIRYDAACDLTDGTSGSPIVEASSGDVVGVSNTGNENGAACTLNNPCEVDETGRMTVERGRNYGQQTYLLYGCLDKENRLDFQLSTCALPKPR